MAWTPEDGQAMDAAADKAMADLEELRKTLSPEQNQAIDKLIAWVAKWKNTAGYKRLMRRLIG